jgi:hypothetical protein
VDNLFGGETKPSTLKAKDLKREQQGLKRSGQGNYVGDKPGDNPGKKPRKDAPDWANIPDNQRCTYCGRFLDWHVDMATGNKVACKIKNQPNANTCSLPQLLGRRKTKQINWNCD